jgi:hypothetical protein
MPVIVSGKETINQSRQVMAQHGKKWKAYAQINSNLPSENPNELFNSGIGKFMLLVGMGPSIEGQIDTIKANRHKVDIFCCDKAFGPLLDRGIKADYVMLCDCNISYDYIKPWIDKTEGVKLISTMYANVRWTKRWKGPKYFYVNRDAIRSEDLFSQYLKKGQERLIPAGSNVSNAMLVFWTGADEKQNINWGGYEKYLLTGFDYSWPADGNYYAWQNPIPKRYYMNHYTCIDVNRKAYFTSENLKFSARWMYSYITSHNLPVVNCSESGLLDVNRNTLENEFAKIKGDKRITNNVRRFFSIAREADSVATKTRDLFNESRKMVYA